jgi:hypothetical protein
MSARSRFIGHFEAKDGLDGRLYIAQARTS